MQVHYSTVTFDHREKKLTFILHLQDSETLPWVGGSGTTICHNLFSVMFHQVDKKGLILHKEMEFLGGCDIQVVKFKYNVLSCGDEALWDPTQMRKV